ncbi:kynurenine formamidase X1 [Biomphalaria glabrata]|nr:kynurenine formamidase X1 [Biomphalaria glabrata]
MLNVDQEPGSEVSLHYVMGLDRTEQSKVFERLAIILMLLSDVPSSDALCASHISDTMADFYSVRENHRSFS